MSKIVVIIVVTLIVLALVVMLAVYYMATHKAKVVGILKTGVLACIKGYGNLVYVEDSPKLFKPSVGDVIKVKHSLALNLSSLYTGKREMSPGEYPIAMGYETSFWSDELRARFDVAVLCSELFPYQWLAVQGDKEILLELGEKDHKMGDVITFIPSSVDLERFYCV